MKVTPLARALRTLRAEGWSLRKIGRFPAIRRSPKTVGQWPEGQSGPDSPAAKRTTDPAETESPPDNLRNQVPEAIETLRAEGWTIREIADHPAIRRGYNTVWQWWRGKATPDDDTAGAVIALVGTRNVQSDPDPRVQLPEALAALRAEGWSLKEIGEHPSIARSASTLSEWEKGRHRPNRRTAQAIIDLVGTRPDPRGQVAEAVASLLAEGWSLKEIGAHPTIRRGHEAISKWSWGEAVPDRRTAEAVIDLAGKRELSDPRGQVVEALARLRAEGWTLREIADEPSVPRAAGTLSKWEKGNIIPDRQTALAIIDLVGKYPDPRGQVPEALATLREEGWSYREIADEPSITRTALTLWRWEKGEAIPDRRNALAIIDLLGTRGLPDPRGQLPEAIATLRAEGWSIKEIADEPSVARDTSSLWQWEKGNSIPDWRTAKAVIDLVGTRTLPDPRGQVPEAIATLRAQGWTLKQLASHQDIQCSLSAIRSWADGRTFPNRRVAQNIIGLVGLRPSPGTSEQRLMEAAAVIGTLLERGWRLGDIGRYVGVSEAAVGAYRSGTYVPSGARVARLKEMLNEPSPGASEQRRMEAAAAIGTLTERGWRLADIAGYVGVSYSAVGAYKSGAYVPGGARIFRLREMLNEPPPRSS